MKVFKYVRLKPITLSFQEIWKKGSLIRYHLYKGLQKLVVSADTGCLKLSYKLFSRHICISMTSRRRIKDSERWSVVEGIEAGQSKTDVALFFAVHHSVISRL